jgi:hypothetical protein
MWSRCACDLTATDHTKQGSAPLASAQQTFLNPNHYEILESDSVVSNAYNVPGLRENTQLIHIHTQLLMF